MCVGLGGTYAGLSHGFCLTYLTYLLLFCHAHLGLVDGFGCCFLAQSFDVSRLVLDVGHIHVDESQTYLLELHFHVCRDGLQEFVTVGVQLLNAHGGYYQTELTEEDVSGQFLNLLCRLSQQTLGSSQHAFGIGTDTHGETAGYIHTDVLLGERIRQIGIYAYGCE